MREAYPARDLDTPVDILLGIVLTSDFIHINYREMRVDNAFS